MSSHPDCIFEIHQLWQSGFSRVYSNCFCSCSFKPEIIKIGLSSHKMYSNSILNSQESTTILNASTKKVRKPIECATYIQGAYDSTIYSSPFFKKINNDGLFHVPEDSQHTLLFWLLHQKLFLFLRIRVFLHHRLSFWLRLVVAKPML